MFSNSKIIPTILDFRRAVKRVYIERSYVELSGFVFAEEKGKDSAPENIIIPDPPTNCCMSGCANCVWIKYAEELANLFHDGGKKSKEIIIDKIDDPNMKAFLLTELRFLESKKS